MKKLDHWKRHLFKRIKRKSFVSMPEPTFGNEFDANPITPYNWEGGVICEYVRGAKNQVWVVKMWLAEGFTITKNDKKIRGNPGNWLIIEGTQKYILTERMFNKKLRRIL